MVSIVFSRCPEWCQFYCITAFVAVIYCQCELNAALKTEDGIDIASMPTHIPCICTRPPQTAERPQHATTSGRIGRDRGGEEVRQPALPRRVAGLRRRGYEACKDAP